MVADIRISRISAKRRVVLRTLAQGLSHTAAAESAGITARQLRRWREEDPDFAEQCEEAIESGTDRLEDVSVKRALSKSDLLLMFNLKARRPAKYRESVAVTGADGGPLSVTVNHFATPVAKQIEATAIPLPSPMAPPGGKNHAATMVAPTRLLGSRNKKTRCQTRQTHSRNKREEDVHNPQAEKE